MSEQMSEATADIPESNVESLKEDVIACANRNPGLYVGVNISGTALDASEVAAVLCKACQISLAKILDPLDPEVCSSRSSSTEWVNHHLSPRDVEYAAEHGCSLCSLLLDGIEATYEGDMPYEVASEFVLGLVEPLGHDESAPRLMDMKYGLWQDDRNFGVLLEQHAGCRTSVLGLPTRQYPPLDLAAQWLANCMRFHTECGGLKGRPLPPRLIDVGWSAASPIRLVETQMGQLGLYAALSHCWGSSSLISVTTKSNIHSRLQEIPFETLPQNFKDALQVTRRLGLKYIWIDSLCITQDDKDDWQAQCVIMRSIYTNAAVSIAPVSASEPSEGFLNQRPGNRWPSVMLSKSNKTGVDSDTVLIKVSMPTGVRYKVDKYWSPRKHLLEDVKKGTHSRAWCFQERLLSRRILSFDAEQMHFECLTCEWHERLREPIRLDTSNGTQDRLEFQIYLLWPGKKDFPHQLIEDYSGRALTLVSDRLPAFSGIARKYQETTRDEYLAGLWKSNLVQGLCWHRRVGNENQVSDLADPLAPSWSWASCPSSVRFYSSEKRILVNVVSASVALVGQDPFGRVNGGQLVISGMPKDCTLADKQPWKSPNSFLLKTKSLHFFDGRVLFAGYMYMDGSVSQNTFTLLPLATNHFSGWNALVLYRLEISPWRYERVGLFVGFSKGWLDVEELDFQTRNGHTGDAESEEMKEERGRILKAKEALEVFEAGPREEITIV